MSNNPVLNIIIADLKAVGNALENFAAAAAKEIWHVVQAVFKAEEAVLMAKAFTLLRQEAVAIQNSTPGVNAPDMESQLKANASNVLATLPGQLAYTALVTVIGTVMHDLSVPTTSGNAGVISAGPDA